MPPLLPCEFEVMCNYGGGKVSQVRFRNLVVMGKTLGILLWVAMAVLYYCCQLTTFRGPRPPSAFPSLIRVLPSGAATENLPLPAPPNEASRTGQGRKRPHLEIDMSKDWSRDVLTPGPNLIHETNGVLRL